MTVWILFNDADDVVEGVFSTEEQAMALHDALIAVKPTGYRVSDYELDELTVERNVDTYHNVCVDAKTGEILRRDSWARIDACGVDRQSCADEPRRNRSGHLPEWSITAQSTVSPEHAIQLAEAKRQEWLARLQIPA